jgi:uncharacterized protein YdaU (DUF1376 family)
MNYWPRWINAIRKRTAELSLIEMGAYDRLLDHYYAEEKPLPGDLERCYRLAGAVTKPEQEAVRLVLTKFFSLADDGFRNERADEEIGVAQPKIVAAQVNGKKGGRPRKNQPGNGPSGPPPENPTGNPPGYQPGLPMEPTPKHPHPHISRNTENYPGSGAGARVGPDDDDPMPGQQPTAAGLLCRRLRQAGIGNVNPGHPRLAALLAVGATEAEFLALTGKAMTASDPFAYLLGAVEGERKRAAETRAQLQGGPAPAQHTEPPVTVSSTEAEKTAAYLAQRAADRPAGGPLPEHVKNALARWRSRKPTPGPAAQPEGEPT